MQRVQSSAFLPRTRGKEHRPHQRLEALVRRAQEGDQDAFAALHARFAPLVHGVLVATVPPQDTGDLLQEVFLSAWSSLADVREPRKLGAWLARIARHRAYRHLARAPQGDEPLVEEPAAVDAPADRSQAILAHLRELPEAYRETLALRLVEGLSGPQIATLTGRSQGAVRVHLSRGMELLRARLRREGWA